MSDDVKRRVLPYQNGLEINVYKVVTIMGLESVNGSWGNRLRPWVTPAHP